MSTDLDLADCVQVGAPEHPRVDVEDAELLTNRLRRALLGAAIAVEHAADLYAEAWTRRADLTLGYRTWDAYLLGRLGNLRGLRIGPDVRRAMALTMKAAGMGQRQTARALGYSEAQLRKDLAAAAPPPVQEVVDAELVDDDGEEPPPGPRTHVQRALAALLAAGPRGLTAVEYGRLAPEVPDPGAVLSELHRYHRAARLSITEPTGTRRHHGRPHAVYLACLDGWDRAAAPLDLTGGRALEGPGRRPRRAP